MLLFAGPVVNTTSVQAKAIQGAVNLELSEEELGRFVREAADLKIRTRMPQVDILNRIYFHFRDNPALLKGETRVVISGIKFANAFAKLEKAFKNEAKGGDGVFQSHLPPPEIQYANFRSIILYGRKGRTRMRIELEKAYVQEIPHTFGAKILLAKIIEAELRADRGGKVTEVLFDGDSYVQFAPPSIAFFIPDVFTRIARIACEGNEVWGHVIGRPKSDPQRYVSVCYNLSTCAKSSISSKEMGPREYSRKIASLD